MAALVLMATYMASGFERFQLKSWSGQERRWKWPWGEGASMRLDDQRFYDNGHEHKVRWWIHVTIAALTYVAVVAIVCFAGTERAGHVMGRSLLAAGAAQAAAVVLIAVAGVWPDKDDPRRFTTNSRGRHRHSRDCAPRRGDPFRPDLLHRHR